MGQAKSKPSGVHVSTSQLGHVAVSARYHRPPRKVEDDYKVEKAVLGTGTNGAVVRATGNEASSNSLSYAVKVFNLCGLSARKRSEVESEVDVFLSLDHPHITRLFDVYESGTKLHLVMECMEGGELFDRITERKQFSEKDAANAVRQMLLAINYLHSHGIVHCDVKLENFLYDRKESEHLKLIDFGLSKVWDQTTNLRQSCGTLDYVAPEVLDRSYTSQCDLWSLGVIAFTLLSGYMPFSGAESITADIKQGKYLSKPEQWDNVSKEGFSFVQSLLQVDPTKRLTAEQALNHPWLLDMQDTSRPEVDIGIIDSMRQYGQTSKFRRCCLTVLAWSLSNDERATVREHFIEMDINKQGTITLGEFKQVMIDKFHVPETEMMDTFRALDSNHDETIHYSDFLAAMLSSRIAFHADLLRSAFKRFDTDNSGYITVGNLEEVLGQTYEGEHVQELMKDADLLKDDRISFDEFVAYLRQRPLESHAIASARIIDKEMKNSNISPPLHLRRKPVDPCGPQSKKPRSSTAGKTK